MMPSGEAGNDRSHTGNLEPPNINRYHFLRHIAEAYFKMTGGLATEGLFNLPKDGRPFMVTPNHESWLDVPALGASTWEAKIYLRILAKTDLWNQRLLGSLFGRYLEGAGAEPTERKGHLANSYVEARMGALVASNAAIVSFVQKSRKNHEPYVVGKEVSPGAALIAMRHGLTIYPTGIAGAREHSCTAVSFGEGIVVDRYDIDLSDRRTITKSVQADARELTEEVRTGIRRNIAAALENHQRRLSKT